MKRQTADEAYRAWLEQRDLEEATKHDRERNRRLREQDADELTSFLAMHLEVVIVK